MLPHRLSWELHNGPIPDGLFVCHHCDNRVCVRPDHLFLGTAADNAHDRDAKGRTNARLTEHDVIDIRTLYAFGAKTRDLAREFGVHQSNVGAILRRETWAHVP